MKNKAVGLAIIIFSIIQFLFAIGSIIYQYSLAGFDFLSISLNFISIIPIPAIFFLIGVYIKNNK